MLYGGQPSTRLQASGLTSGRKFRTGCGAAGVSAAEVRGEGAYGVWTPIQHPSAAATCGIRYTRLGDGLRSNAGGRRAEREKDEEGRGKGRFHDEWTVDNPGSESLRIDGPGGASLYQDS